MLACVSWNVELDRVQEELQSVLQAQIFDGSKTLVLAQVHNRLGTILACPDGTERVKSSKGSLSYLLCFDDCKSRRKVIADCH